MASVAAIREFYRPRTAITAPAPMRGGAGVEALDAHRDVGFTVHAFEVLVLVAALVAWLRRRDLGLSLLLAVGGTVQLALASAEKWTGALHPLGALFALALGTVLVRRDLSAVRSG